MWSDDPSQSRPAGAPTGRQAAHDLLDRYGHLSPADPREILDAARQALRSGPHPLSERPFADVALTMPGRTPHQPEA